MEISERVGDIISVDEPTNFVVGEHCFRTVTRYELIESLDPRVTSVVKRVECMSFMGFTQCRSMGLT